MPTDSTDTDVSCRGGDLDPMHQAVALFRYSVIADMTQLPLQHRGLYKLLTEKADREYAIPGSLRRRVAAETIRGWLRAYRRGGFDALVPKQRADEPAPIWWTANDAIASPRSTCPRREIGTRKSSNAKLCV